LRALLDRGLKVARLAIMIPRISPDQAHQHLTDGKALIVCAYDSDEKFRANYLAGAMSLQQLQALEDRLSPDQEIIFYCA
jgi:hypothetical protein